MFWKWLIWQASSYDPFPRETDYHWGEHYRYCTCHRCIGHWNCDCDRDLYNTDGDCLGLK